MYDIEEFINNYFPDIPHYKVEYDGIGFASRNYLDCVMFVLDRKANIDHYKKASEAEFRATELWCAKYECE